MLHIFWRLCTAIGFTTIASAVLIGLAVLWAACVQPRIDERRRRRRVIRELLGNLPLLTHRVRKT